MKARLKHFFFCLLGLLLLASSNAVSYTVQVIAVSTEPSALKLMETLNDEGYPSYLISVPTPEGPVYRIRVGSFANRNAASKFADAMNGILDSNPTPALAEGIPSDLAPLEADLVNDFSNEYQLEVLPWQGEVAFRSQLKTGLSQAHYRVVDITEFDAWRAAPQRDGSVIRVYSEYLWPESYSILTSNQLRDERQKVLERVSDEFGLSVSQLEGFEFTGLGERPFLILVDQTSPSGERRLLKAIGQPDSTLTLFGPELIWLDQQEILINPIEPLFVPANADIQAELISSEDWLAQHDNGFIRIEVETNGEIKNWRAAAGSPLWLRENWLIARQRNHLFLYKFQKR